MPRSTPTPSSCVICRKLTHTQLTAIAPLNRKDAADAASAYAGESISQHYVRMHRNHAATQDDLGAPKLFSSEKTATAPQGPVLSLPEAPKGYDRSVELGPDGGELSTGTLTEPVKDWTFVFERFNLDPNEFEIVEDTVRMSSWPLARVDRDTEEVVEHWLYAYKARFRRRAASLLPTADVAALFARVRAWEAPKAPEVPVNPFLKPVTFVVNWADWQLGKGEGGGVAATVERVQASIAATVARFHELVAIGRQIERIVVANLGDPFEGVSGNYANQTFTVELNLRDQLNLVLDLWLSGLRVLLPLAPKAMFISVLCNHTQWTRNGGKSPITDDSDNGGAFLAETAKRVLEHQPGFEHVEWIIARDEVIMPVELSGVLVAFSHGHTAKGDIKKWTELQMVRQRNLFGSVALWVVAHRHHFYAVDDLLQCPALDGGSKWLTDMNGSNSPTGTLTFIVGEHLGERVWSDLAVL